MQFSDTTFTSITFSCIIPIAVYREISHTKFELYCSASWTLAAPFTVSENWIYI